MKSPPQGRPRHLVIGARPGVDLDTLVQQLRGRPGAHDLVVHRADDTHPVAHVAQAAARRAQQDDGLLLACGGDGTLNAVARAAWPLGVPLAVLPHGTFNYFSRNLGLGDDALAAFDALFEPSAQPQWRPWRVGLVNDEPFLVNASVGLYPRLLAEREEAKRRLGRHRWVAWLSGARTMLAPMPTLRLVLQARRGGEPPRAEVERELATLFVGANALQLQRLGLPAPPPDADGLTAVLMPPQPRVAMARLAWRALRGRLPEAPEVESFALDEMEVHAGARQRRRVRVALDGEPRWMQLPLRMTRALRPLWLLCPPAEPVEPTTAARGAALAVPA